MRAGYCVCVLPVSSCVEQQYYSTAAQKWHRTRYDSKQRVHLAARLLQLATLAREPAAVCDEQQYCTNVTALRDVCSESELYFTVMSVPGALVDYTVCERVTVSWGGGGSLVWTGGGGALRMMRDDFYAAIRDISFVMKKRAQTDYGLKVRTYTCQSKVFFQVKGFVLLLYFLTFQPDLWQNADLADDDTLSGLWHFLALSKSLVEDGEIFNIYNITL